MNMALREQRLKRNKSRSIPYRLAYLDQEEYDEFADMDGPMNLGRRRPRLDEWGDYIEDEQMLHIENLMNGELTDISEMSRDEMLKGGTLGNLGGIKVGPILVSDPVEG